MSKTTERWLIAIFLAAVVSGATSRLFGRFRRKPKHGQPTICTTCGAKGRWDMSPEPDVAFEDSVWVLTRDRNGAVETTWCWACHDN